MSRPMFHGRPDDGCDCSDCIYDHGRLSGREEERAAIVAWLRRNGHADGTWSLAADLIERGEHEVKPPEAPARGVAGDRCESGSECGRPGCPECQQ